MQARYCPLPIDCERDTVQRTSEEPTEVHPFQGIAPRIEEARTLRVGAKNRHQPAYPLSLAILRKVKLDAGRPIPTDASIRLSKLDNLESRHRRAAARRACAKTSAVL